MPAPVNRFPDFVAEVIRRLKVTCPTLGNKRIPQTLARAGLHLGVSTVRRVRKAAADPSPTPKEREENARPSATTATTTKTPVPVRSRGPNHTWMADLTAVPILRGLWVPWFPQSVLLRWPFCWWVGCIVDHTSRRVIAHQVYSARPGGAAIVKLLDAAANDAGTAPKYLITDLGPEFANEDREAWCLRRGVVSRYASADHHRATSVIERFFRSLKQEAFRLPSYVVPSLTAFEAKLKRYVRWFNEDRPHQGLGGRTPNEVYEGRTPANRAPRFEPRTSWPRNAVCAGPQARPKRKPGGELVLDVHFVDDDPALPKIELRCAA